MYTQRWLIWYAVSVVSLVRPYSWRLSLQPISSAPFHLRSTRPVMHSTQRKTSPYLNWRGPTFKLSTNSFSDLWKVPNLTLTWRSDILTNPLFSTYSNSLTQRIRASAIFSRQHFTGYMASFSTCAPLSDGQSTMSSTTLSMKRNDTMGLPNYWRSWGL